MVSGLDDVSELDEELELEESEVLLALELSELVEEVAELVISVLELELRLSVEDESELEESVEYAVLEVDGIE